ncbi:MAG: hypothetical protein ABFD04_14600 [Syntrophomonas sp.]
MKTKFADRIRKSFLYLETKYNFELIKSQKDPFGEYVLYKNSTTAVQIRYEWREKKLFILLIRLINDQIPEYPHFIKLDTKLNHFYFDDVMTLVLNRPLKKNEMDSEMDFEKSIKFYSKALEEYGRDILMGDFKVFSELEKLVKKRAADYEEHY